MPQHVWKRDVLTALTRLRLARELHPRVQRLVLAAVLRSGHAPPPSDAMLAELADVFTRWGGYSPVRARVLAAEHSATMYRAGLLWYMLRMTPAEGIEPFLERWVRVEGEEVLRAASARGPVVVFSGHYGLPVSAVLAAARALRGRTRVNTFFASADDNPSTAGFAEVFANAPYGINSIQVSPRAPVAALRALRAGEVLTMQPDVYDNRNASAVVVPFLNGLTYAMTGTAYLALRAQAALVPVFTYVDRRGQVVVSFEAPLDFERRGDDERDGLRMTAAMYARIEERIRDHPDQWVYWQVLAERMVPFAVLPEERRHDAAAWREAYAGARQWASQTLPSLRDDRFSWPDGEPARIDMPGPTQDRMSALAGA